MTYLTVAEVRELEAWCPHDMIHWPTLGLTSCAICKRLPVAAWPILLDTDTFTTAGLLDDGDVDGDGLTRVEVGFDAECVTCGDRLRAGGRAAWSPVLRGLLCPACERAA